MYCRKCGKENPDTAKFCRACGSPLVRVNKGSAAETGTKKEPVKTPEKTPANMTPQGSQPAPGGKGGPGRRYGKYIAAVCVVLLAAALAVVVLGRGKTKNSGADAAREEASESSGKSSGSDDSKEMDSSEESASIEESVTPETLEESQSFEAPASSEAALQTDSAEVVQESKYGFAESAALTTPGATGSMSQEEKILYIREIYYAVEENPGNYIQDGSRYYNSSGALVKAIVSDENVKLSEAMKKNGYKEFKLQYYFDDISGNPLPVFVFAVIDGKEYRYYFWGEDFIRRIGPDGSVNDSPQKNSFIETILEVGSDISLT